jgi:hypothetical protein
MHPTIFIHLNNDTKFLRYCLENFKDKCEIVVNFYGKKPEVLNFVKENAHQTFEIKPGGKNEIVRGLPLLFPFGIWVCNDDVEVEGDVWGMFEYANATKDLDLVYPPTDNLYIDNTKIGIHNRHRLSSSAFFLTAAGIKKFKLGLPLAYTHTYYGVNIKHVQKIKTVTPIASDTISSFVHEECSHLRTIVDTELLNVVNTDVQPLNTKNIIVTLATKGRNFLNHTKDQLAQTAKDWGADFKIFYDIEEIMSPEQIEQLSEFKSKREHIINYFAKMMCVNEAFKNYERVLWLDDTCIVSPFAQNLFAVVPFDEFGGLIIKQRYGMGESNHDAEFIRQRREIETADLYINTGVMLASTPHKDLFSFESMMKDVDLFESFYPTQAYLIYKFTSENIPVYDIKPVNHFMPAMLKYEDKLFMHTESLKDEIKTIASHGIVHFSGFHKKREILHKQIFDKFNEIFDQKITLVLMNFSRPENIINKILPFYSTIPAISQIIISHCKEDAKFNFESSSACKIIHRDDVLNDSKYGLFTRYIAAAESSTNNCTVVVDDDMIVPAHVLAQLFLEWKKNPTKVIGTRGRVIEKINGMWKYDGNKFVTNPDVVLTHCAMTSINIFRQLLDQEPYFRDLAMSAKVPWNGEDIMLSLFAKFINQDKNIAIHCKYIELDDSHAISSTEDHNQSRDNLTDEVYKYYMKRIYNTIMV